MREKNKLKIAIVQPEPQNQMTQLVKYVKKAHLEDVALILFPEGYLPSYKDQDALSLEDKIIRSIKKLSNEHELVIATGIKERLGRNLFLSLVLFGQGDILAVHRKVFLAESEKSAFSARELKIDAGDVFPVAKVKGIGNVGCLLCYENMFPETHRLLRFRGAEIVLGPSGFGMKSEQYDYRESWLCELRSRAMENKMYVVSATNAIGEGLMGVVIDPAGRVLLDEDTEGYNCCSIDLAYLRNLRTGSGLGKEIDHDMLKINISRVPPAIYKTLYSESELFRKRAPHDE